MEKKEVQFEEAPQIELEEEFDESPDAIFEDLESMR